VLLYSTEIQIILLSIECFFIQQQFDSVCYQLSASLLNITSNNFAINWVLLYSTAIRLSLLSFESFFTQQHFESFCYQSSASLTTINSNHVVFNLRYGKFPFGPTVISSLQAILHYPHDCLLCIYWQPTILLKYVIFHPRVKQQQQQTTTAYNTMSQFIKLDKKHVSIYQGANETRAM